MVDFELLFSKAKEAYNSLASLIENKSMFISEIGNDYENIELIESYIYEKYIVENVDLERRVLFEVEIELQLQLNGDSIGYYPQLLPVLANHSI